LFLPRPHVFLLDIQQNNEASVAAATNLRDNILRAVEMKEMVVVCNGVTDVILPALDPSSIPVW
jgi:hypothetical protein